MYTKPKSVKYRLRAQKNKQLLEIELASVKDQLRNAEEARVTEGRAREEAENSLRRVQSEIMDLRNTTGRLQLELKCALNEKELCEYRLA